MSVLGCILALRLCKRSQNGKHEFAGTVQRIDVLQLKQNTDTDAFEFPGELQHGLGISGKARDAFYNYQINFTRPGIRNHLLELRAFFIEPGYAEVRIYPAELPAGVCLDVAGEVANLVVQGIFQFFGVHGHSGIGAYPQFIGLGLHGRLYHFYLHDGFLLSFGVIVYSRTSGD